MKKILLPFYLLVLVFGLQACGSDDDPVPVEIPEPPVVTTIVDVAVGNGNFTTLVAALQATGLDAVLDDAGSTFTVFAPTDAAFELLGQETIDALLADTDTLSSILTYHVLPARVDSGAAIAAAGTRQTTVNGKDIGISVSGQTVFINGVTVTTTDVEADNGIIHVIDAVLIPPADVGTPSANIVDTAVAAGDFTTLVTALQATGLDTVLADPDAEFTVFAPTDAAFEVLGAEVIETLLFNTDVLSSILLQHVVAGSVDSISAFTLNGVEAETASGALIPIGLNQTTDTLTFGGANIVTTDIYTTNGIIHVIDMVIVDEVEVPAPPVSLVERAVEAGNFTTLVAALQATGLDAVLDDVLTDYTVFAPTDEAFALLGQATIDALLADPEALAEILLYHVVPNATILADAAINAAGSKLTTANGKEFGVSFSDGTLFINGVSVTTTNVLADNGVIHVVDAVIIPPADPVTPTANIVETAVAAGDFTTLVAALQATGLDAALADPEGDFTVFAPTDAAFDILGAQTIGILLDNPEVLTEILLQHVVEGSVDSITAFTLNGVNAPTLSGNNIAIGINAMLDTPTFGGANVVVADIQTTNGIIHVIDMVVVADVEVPAPALSLTETAVEAGNFTTLVAALQATGLDAVLGNEANDYTVFAPTDAAFALLGQATIDALLADPDALSDILLYHVLPGTILADQAISSAGSTVATANGQNFALSLTGETLFVNGVSVTATNILASNGVIHVIDAVLIPPTEPDMPMDSVVDIAVGNADFSTLVAALQAANLVTALSGDGPFTVFAPTNDAFAALGQDALDFLLDPANVAVLTEILTQHVVAAEVNSIAAFTLNGQNATTLSTNEIAIGINAELDTPTFGGANVITADLFASNGIIHVIDEVVIGDVVLPGSETVSAPADFSGAFGGGIVADDVYTFPTGAESFAGFANNNTDLYPFTFPNGGLVRFTASIPGAGPDTNVRFVFENAPFPDVNPNFSTANVLVSGGTDTQYEVAIPAQDPAQGFSSFLLYVVERDQPVKVTNVVVVTQQ